MTEYVCELEDATYEMDWTPKEKIVRCRDCERAYEVDGGMYDCLGKLTTEWDCYYDEPQQNLVEPDGFCAWGVKRKEGGDD